MRVLVDSCVYLDVFGRDKQWYDWSANALAKAAAAGTIVLNPVVYAEISIKFDRIEELEALLPQNVFELCAIPREAAFLASKCYLRYRRRGGRKLSPLPDFFIGAHAAVANLRLVTRDPKRFRDYFPDLQVLCP